MTAQDQLPALDFFNQVNYLYSKIKEIKVREAKYTHPEIDKFKTLKLQIDNLKNDNQIISDEFEKFKENARTKETKIKNAEKLIKEYQEQIDNL